MAASTVSIPLVSRDGNRYHFPLLTAAVKLLEGVLWARNAAGYITNATGADGEKVVGMGSAEVDNSAGSAGDLNCNAVRGIYQLVNSSANAVALTNVGQPCYVEDNQTVATKGAVVAGIVVDVDDDGVWVDVAKSPMEASIGRRRPVLVDADGASLESSESGMVISNLGASGAATFVLPPATAGLEFIFIVEAAQELRIDPDGTETVALPATGVQQAAGKYITANAVGENIHLICTTAGTWCAISFAGTWTAEA